MQNHVRKLITEHGIALPTAAVSLACVIVSVSISALYVWISGDSLYPALYLSIVTPALIAPPVTYVQFSLIRRLDTAEREIAIRERLLRRELVERRRAESESQHDRLQLVHATRQNILGEMAAGLAHEINQPLTAVTGYLDIALRRLDENAPESAARESIAKAAEQIRRANEIMNWIRSFIQKAEPKKTETDLNAVVREVSELLNFDSGQFDVEVDLNLADGLHPVEADPVQIQQVLLNLARNGLEAMTGVAESSRRLIIATRNAGSGFVEVTVTNPGDRIPPDQMTRIFEPFVTTKEGGLGMGLSVSRSIVEAHGGSLAARQPEAAGAEFYFTLPEKAERAEAVA